MFKPLQMKKIRILIIDNYLDKVMNMLGKKGALQITKVEESEIKPPERKKIIEGYSNLLNKINVITDILGIEDIEDRETKTLLQEKPTEEYLGEIEETIEEIYKETKPIAEKLGKIKDEKTTLEDHIIALNALDKIEVDTDWLGVSDFMYTTSGFINPKNIDELTTRLNEITKKQCIILTKPESLPENKNITVIATLKQYQHDVEGILRGLRFETLNITYRNLDEIEKKLKIINKEEKKLHNDLEKIKYERFNDILVAKEITEIEKNTQNSIINFGKTQRVYVLEGWIPAKEVDPVSKEIEEITEGCNLIQTNEPNKKDDVPVSYNNPKAIKPFEIVMDMFGLPAYTEIDPTPIMAITFPLFFGLMFGDVGHGAIFALLGLGIIYKKRGNESMWKIGMLLFYCGMAAVIFGFMYGSFFGDEEMLPHTYKELGIGHAVEIEHNGHIEEIWVLWMSPPHQMMDMIGITLLFGAIHMVIGLIMNVINNLIESGSGTLIQSISKVWFLIGEVAVIAVVFPFPIPFFSSMKDTVPLANILLIGLAIPGAGILLSELTHALHDFSIKKFIGITLNGLFEIFELFSMFLSNTISYSRLLILAVVHAMMMTAIYKIANMEALSGLFIVSLLIIIGGNILVLVLEGLVVFIHTIRLHFYEWFTKFHRSGGIKYAPYIVERKYTELN